MFELLLARHVANCNNDRKCGNSSQNFAYYDSIGQLNEIIAPRTRES